MKVETIAIIGCGKVGASIGLAFKKALPDLKVIGHDRSQKAANAAKEIGAIDESLLNLVAAASRGDIVVLTESLPETEKTMAAIGRDLKEHAVVIDTCALKRPVQKWADKYLEKGHYVGLAPIPAAGAIMSVEPTADLYRDSVVAMMPNPTADGDAVETAETIGRIFGASPFYVGIDEFDIYSQALSTLPGVLSAAYFRTITETTGWQDMLRIAGEPFAMQTFNLTSEDELAASIYQDKTAAIHWIDQMTQQLGEMRALIEKGTRPCLGPGWRSSTSAAKSGSKSAKRTTGRGNRPKLSGRASANSSWVASPAASPLGIRDA